MLIQRVYTILAGEIMFLSRYLIINVKAFQLLAPPIFLIAFGTNYNGAHWEALLMKC